MSPAQDPRGPNGPGGQPSLLLRIRGFAGAAAVAWTAAVFSGCGGGGGSGDGPPEPPSPVQVSVGGGSGGGGSRLPNCIATAAHGCVSKEEFDRLRDDRAAEILADPEFVGSTTNPELLGQPALERLNVHDAHAALAIKYGADVKPGEGVTIGVFDSGVDPGHREFEGASITETFLQNLPDEMHSDFGPGDYSHGTAVTSVMAAQPNDAGFVGVAWGATFKVFTAPFGDHLEEDAEIKYTFDWAKAYRDALDDGVDIVNASYGLFGTFVENYTADGLRSDEEIASYLGEVAQKGVADPAIFVWAAGNDHGDPCEDGDENCVPDAMSRTGYRFDATSPNLDGGAVALLPELQGHNVVVVAVDEDGKIADFSNRCGVAGRWCIAAPGTGLRGARFDSRVPPTTFGSENLEGTSFATPLVSGGLALIKHFFRGQLSNRELVTRLLVTAENDGIYASDRTDGTSSIYGQGLMDLGAAVSPVRGVRLTQSSPVDPGGHSVHGTRLGLGPAFGDGLSRSLAGGEIASFDSLGAPFWLPLETLVRPSYRPPSLPGRHPLAARDTGPSPADPRGDGATLGLHAFTARPGGWWTGLREPPAEAGSHLLNLAENATTVTLTAKNGLEAAVLATSSHEPRRESDLGAMLAWRPPGRPFGVRTEWFRETGSVLGSTASGAFGSLSADSVYAGFEATGRFGGWRLVFDAEIGSVGPDAEGGLLDGMSGLTTSAFFLHGDRRLTARDDLTVVAAQPLRIESGTAELDLPAGRTPEGALVRESVSANLVPSARQLDLMVHWRRTGVLGGEFRAAGAVSFNAGHSSAAPVIRVMAGWRAES